MNRLYLAILLSILFLIHACTYVQKIQNGSMAYERKQYAVAVDMLKKEFSKEKSRVEKGKLAFKLAKSYSALQKNFEAIDWYKIAYDNSAGIDALKEYAFALKKNEQYKEAQQAFKELGIEIGSPYEYRKEISACKIAADWKKEKNNYDIENLDWNSPKSDYSPTLYTDNQILFTSDRASSNGEEVYNWTGNDFSDLFLTSSEGNVNAFPAPINTAKNEGTATFNGDFTEMIFTRCFDNNERNDQFCQLMQSSREGDAWSEPIVLNFTQPDIRYGHPSLTKDGGKLYFACNDPEGWGGFDIWVSERTPEGWGIPKLLSRSINTIGDEKFPFIDADTLYFSSTKHTGMGGLDIFKSYQIDDNRWSSVQNLKPPINSGSDDFGFIIDYQSKLKEKQLQIGYFSSSRLDGKGLDDIYRYEKLVPPPPPVEPEKPKEVEKTKAIVYQLLLKGFVVEKIYQDPNNPSSKVLGRRPLANAKVDAKLGNKNIPVQTKDDGSFELELDFEKDYYFFGSKEGYLNNDERFSTRGIAKDPKNPVQEFELEILLDKIFKNREIVLDNIYYDFDKWDIREDAKPTLNELARVLAQNPTLNIQLSSHTDCQGNPNYNQSLSQKRAQSAVTYLVSQGISSERLTAVGYGENSLLIDCQCQRCNDDEHQANRRTTFKILE